MSYSKKDILTSISFMLFILSFAIVFVVFFKPLYYFDIDHLKLVENTRYTYQQLKENYQILIHYQSIFYQGKLVFKDFIMSKGGRIHFEEVKRVFEMIQITFVVTGIISAVMIYLNVKQKEYRFLPLTSFFSVAIPSVLGFFVALDFDKAFVIFHNIVFRNDYWIFDYTTDPVITILPESFFMHCFMMIIVIVIMISVLCYVLYKKKRNQILAG